MSYFRRYELLPKNTSLRKGEQSPGTYRKLTEDEVCMEWARTRERLSVSPPASPPVGHTGPDTFPLRSDRAKRPLLTDSLLRKLKESKVDSSDEECASEEDRHEWDGRVHDMTISGNSSVSTDSDSYTQPPTDRTERFDRIGKRQIIRCSAKRNKKAEGEQTEHLVPRAKEFVLVTETMLTSKGMEQSVVDFGPVYTSDSELPESPLHEPGVVKCVSDLNIKPGLTPTKVNRETKTRMDDSMQSVHNEESCYSEREVCYMSNYHSRSVGSTSDDDTLHSVSSDEVHVYVNDIEHGLGGNKGRLSQKTMTSPQSNQETIKIGSIFRETPPRMMSTMGDRSTPQDNASFSESSPDVSSRSHNSSQEIVIPKIRIIGESGEEESQNRDSALCDQCLSGSRDVSVDSLDGAITRRSQRSSIDSGTEPDPVKQAHNHFVVVAIDFGTTYSGYAFSFSREKEKIYMMRKWEGGDPGVINQKTLTTLLLTPDEKFHSFGFTARDTFHNLKAQESKKWHFFEKFKMVLHYSTDLNTETSLRSSSGRLIPALKIFTFALEFFKNHALQELSDMTGTPIMDEDVRWVITVPAIWRAQAKQFMRQAAYQAGIGSELYPDRLLIALEPEAASVCCRKLRMHQVVPEPSHPSPLLSPRQSSNQLQSQEHVMPATLEGARYLVVDCGGGTVDITAHEIQDNSGRLRELYRATGGPYGSVGVDIEFENLLCAIFGTDFIQHFQQKRPAGWDDLMIAFESRKRSAYPDKLNPLNVSLPFSFIDLYRKVKGGQMENAVRKYGDPHIRWSSQGMLRLSPEAMRRMFLPTLNRIKQTIGDIMNHPDARGLTYMFLVGGFSESRILQSEIRREFGHLLRVIIPQGVSLAILEGAVLFGWDPSVVNIRRSRLTYGIGVLNRFDPEKHPESKRIFKNGINWCADVFQSFVTVNQSVALGDTVVRSYTPARPGQKTSIINIFCSDRPDVQFVTDTGVRRCGTLCLDLSESEYQHPAPSRREIQTKMYFGDTEIKVTALDVASGKCVRAGIDFLNK